MTTYGLNEDAFNRTRQTVLEWEGRVRPGVDPIDLPFSEYTVLRDIAILTEEVGEGKYSGKSIFLDEDGNPLDDTAQIFYNEDTEGVGNLLELNATTGIAIGSIVHCFAIGLDEGGKDGSQVLWFFVAGGAGSFAVDRSIVLNIKAEDNPDGNGAAIFQNDIKRNANAFGVNVPDIMGGVIEGFMIYSGQEDSLIGRQRHWEYALNAAQRDFNRFGPQADPNDLNGKDWNSLWLRQRIINNGRTVYTWHDVLDTDKHDDADYAFPGLVNGKYGLDKAAIDALPADNNPVTHNELKDAVILEKVDRTGHYTEIDGNVADGETPSEDLEVELLSGDRETGTSGSAYSEVTTVDQEVRIVDEDGNNTDVYNGAGNLLYAAFNGEGVTIELGKPGGFANSPTLLRDAEEYDAGPPAKNGNNDAIKYNFARNAFNTIITVQATLQEEPKPSVFFEVDAKLNNMELQGSFDVQPGDGTNFTVKTLILQNGADFIRFNALVPVEYEIRTDLYYFSDDTFIVSQVTDVAALGGGESGVEETFNFAIPAERLNDKIKAFSTLVWKGTGDEQPGMKGDTNLQFATTISDITGSNNYTHEVNTDMESYPSENNEQVIDLVNIAVLTSPVNGAYEILDAAAATTDFSDGNKKTTMRLFHNGNYITFYADPGSGPVVVDNLVGLIEDILPNQGNNNTDGLNFGILGIEAAEVTPGGEYQIEFETEGFVQDAKSIFEFDDSGALFCWFDGFGDNESDEPFPWPDFGGGDGTLESTDSINTDRWDETISTNGSISVNSQVVTMEAEATNGLGLTKLALKFPDLNGDFDIQIDLEGVGWPVPPPSNDEQHAALLWVTIGGTQYAAGVRQSSGVGSPGSDPEGNVYFNPYPGSANDQLNTNVSTTARFMREGDQLLIDAGNGWNTTITKTGALSAIEIRNESFKGSGTIQSEVTATNFIFKVKNYNDSWIDYWTLNAERWSVTNTGDAYDFVNSDDNVYTQIVGLDTLKETYLNVVGNGAVNMIMGYEETGSGAYGIFCDADGSNLFSEDRTGQSFGYLTIERGDFYIGDTFNGLGQNSGSETDGKFGARFENTSTMTGSTAVISSDSLVITAPVNTLGNHQEEINFFDPISGTFDFQIDCSITMPVGASGKDSCYFGLRIEFSDGSRAIAGIWNNFGTFGTNRIGYQTFGIFGSQSNDTTIPSTFTIRIYRDGSDDVYAVVGGYAFTKANKTQDVVAIDIQVQNDAAALVASWSATISEIRATKDGQDLASKMVLFKEDSNLLTAYDLATNDIEAADIVTRTGVNESEATNLFDDVQSVTTDTWLFGLDFNDAGFDDGDKFWAKFDKFDAQSPKGTNLCTDPPP